LNLGHCTSHYKPPTDTDDNCALAGPSCPFAHKYSSIYSYVLGTVNFAKKAPFLGEDGHGFVGLKRGREFD
jgi:hypothetical protein